MTVTALFVVFSAIFAVFSVVTSDSEAVCVSLFWDADCARTSLFVPETIPTHRISAMSRAVILFFLFSAFCF